MDDELNRLRNNHKDVVETKRRTDERLAIALEALQQIYTVCGDNVGEKCDHWMALNFVRDVASDGFERATTKALSSTHQRGEAE